MQRSLMFFANSVLLGVGLTMDAFSVSMNNTHRRDFNFSCGHFRDDINR